MTGVTVPEAEPRPRWWEIGLLTVARWLELGAWALTARMDGASDGWGFARCATCRRWRSSRHGCFGDEFVCSGCFDGGDE